ncbi:hypothetical protein K3495_g11012 [Podosphaera aphanis]|nr:hypothetical protein K3495_g11012 [Podosphaera aphanis]
MLIMKIARRKVIKQNYRALQSIADIARCMGPAPQRFKFKIKDDFNFNFAIIIDIMYLDGKTPVLHVVDKATRYQAAQFLKDVSAQTLWETLPYYLHHVDKLGMTNSTFDMCLLHKIGNSSAFGVVGLQTNDTLILGNKDFVKKETDELRKAKFLAKPIEKLTPENPLTFNGMLVSIKNDTTLSISQDRLVQKLQHITTSSNKNDYVAQRARKAYIASVPTPQAAFSLSIAAQSTNPAIIEKNSLNTCIEKNK